METSHPLLPPNVRPVQVRSGPISRLSILLGCLMALGISACASGGGGERSAANRDILSQEEILRSNSQDLYSVIDNLRPRWIRGGRVVSPYGASSGESVVVYFDQSRQGGPEMLRGIPLSGISEIRFFSGLDAQQRFGLDHRMGAIVVTFSPRG